MLQCIRRVGAAYVTIISRCEMSGLRHSGMVRKHQTRNLEIPGSMLRIAPEWRYSDSPKIIYEIQQ